MDTSKAFDIVNHYKLFDSLIKAGILLVLVLVSANWYEKLFVAVSWNGSLSYWFSVWSGVRHGRVLSPAIFAVLLSAVATDSIVFVRVFFLCAHDNS